MRVGAENRTKLAAMIVLLVVAAVSFARMLVFRSAAPAAAAATSPENPARQAQRRAARGRTSLGVLPPTLDPRLRLDLLKSSEQTKYAGSGRNIFRAQEEPPPIPTPVASALKDQAKTGPPPPPPINLKFFGFASRPGEAKRIFLAQGDDVFISGEGEVVKGRYKIVRINPNSVEVEDMLSNSRQTIPLTQS